MMMLKKDKKNYEKAREDELVYKQKDIWLNDNGFNRDFIKNS
jgi:hypothetical protein